MQTCRTGMRFHGIFFAAVRVLLAHSDRNGLEEIQFCPRCYSAFRNNQFCPLHGLCGRGLASTPR
jgi:hypothetical protein